MSYIKALTYQNFEKFLEEKSSTESEMYMEEAGCTISSFICLSAGAIE